MQPVDYVWLVLSILVMAFGLIRGFSGVFAFLVATVLSGAGVALGWNGFLPDMLEETWMRVVAAVLLFVVVFALVRWTVGWTVGKLLAQPADSIFGFCLGVVCGAALMWAIASSPALRDHSFLAREVHARLR